jgi:predicted ATPase
MNNLITKIEINSFRSIEKIIVPVKEINVFSGANDIGKSNILKAINLFFNSQTDFLKPLKFEDDYNMVSRAKAIRSSKMKQLIKIRLYIKPPSSYKTLSSEKDLFIERQYDRAGERSERFSTDDQKKRTSIKRIINKVKYVYIPALKGESVLQYLLSLIGEQQLITDQDILSLNEKISDKTKDLKEILNKSEIQIGTNFGLPTLLSDFWQKLSVNTSYEQFDKLNREIKGSNKEKQLNSSQFSISLLNRGEGLKSKYIPPLLKWLDNNDRTKEFIWGIDEPENSLEFGLSDKLARLFFNEYSSSNQIFLTSHSLAFINPPKDITNQPRIFKIVKDEFGSTQWEDMEDLFKKQSKLKLYDELGILIAQKEFIEEYRNVVSEKEKLKSKVETYTVPIVIVEGKSDKFILEKAWKALNPQSAIPFDIYPSGIYIDVNESEGNADQVKRAIELISPMIDESITIVGLFDNDREGNEQFKGLNKKIFEDHNIQKISRKHKTKNIYGLLLPVTDDRKIFVGDKIIQRFFEMEHYFDDAILNQYNLKGDKVAPDSSVFSIKSKNKISFAENKIDELDSTKFSNFIILFQKLTDLISNAGINTT